VEHAAALTSLVPRGIDHIMVKIKQKLVEPDVCQQGLVQSPSYPAMSQRDDQDRTE
jgi:hypothetical protein